MVTAESLPTELPHTLSEASLLLREDDSLLRQTFFEIVHYHHPHLAGRIDDIYQLSMAWCKTESDKDFQALEKALSELNPDELILVRPRCSVHIPILALIPMCVQTVHYSLHLQSLAANFANGLSYSVRTSQLLPHQQSVVVVLGHQTSSVHNIPSTW